MRVAVVQVGIVRVAVDEPRVPVPVRVRLARRIVGAVRVPVVLVMHVRVLVLHRLVHMLVLVPLGEMEPDAEAHEPAGGEQLQRQRLAEGGDREERPDERCRREVGAGAPSRGAAAPR